MGHFGVYVARKHSFPVVAILSLRYKQNPLIEYILLNWRMVKRFHARITSTLRR